MVGPAMTYRSLLLFALCATTVACSEDDGRAPAVKPIEQPKDAYVADLSIPEDTAVDEDAVVDSTVDSTIVDTAPADTAPEVDGDVLVDAMSEVPATCLNGSKDEGETDIDCGGMLCGKCAVGKTCAVDGDCADAKCNPSSKVCNAPACNDGVRNGDETDVDCGGPSCLKCADTKKCALADDCVSGVCSAGLCSAPTCSDRVRNGGESDIDCGGTCASKCNIGNKCFGNPDCQSQTCVSGTCRCPTGMTQIFVPTAGGTYCVDATEVTNAQYGAFLVSGFADPLAQEPECRTWNTLFTPTVAWPAPPGTGNNPVRGVDWCDAYAFCKAQGKKLCGKIGGGPTPFDKYNDATVSKWQNTCSQGVNPYPYGSAYNATICNGADRWIDAGVPGPWETTNTTCYGGPESNVFQLSGNVAEWEDSCDAVTGGADNCLVRGGSFSSNEEGLKCGTKRAERRDAKTADIGIRCCL